MVGPQPEFRDGPAIVLLGITQRYAYAQRMLIPAQWMRLAPYLGKIEGQVGSPYDTFGAISAQPGGFDYLVGVKVAEGAQAPDGFVRMEIPARRYAVFTHEGHISGLPALFDYIAMEWGPANVPAMPPAPQSLEVYDGRFNPVTGMGTIEVWVAI